MRFLYSIVLVATLVSSFQNCSHTKAAQPEGKVQVAGEDKLLGVYDLSEVSSLRFYYVSGMVPFKLPEVTVSFAAGVPVSAAVTVYNENNQIQCINTLTLDSGILNNPLLSMTLENAPVQMAYVADCGGANLEINLADSSKHSYIFQSMCTINGELSIKHGEALQTAFGEIIDQLKTCPVATN